jgi:NAD(P)-dependent dehydrogenase (short-subunit alcohol dehydrogenase family)
VPKRPAMQSPVDSYVTESARRDEHPVLCKAALRQLQPGSAIINTGSEQAYQPSPSLLAYASTKAAIVNFSKGLALEVIGRAAQPVEVAPAFVFLASQESSYIAGETIAVTGGTPLP